MLVVVVTNIVEVGAGGHVPSHARDVLCGKGLTCLLNTAYHVPPLGVISAALWHASSSMRVTRSLC